MGRPVRDLTGKRFGRLSVIRYVGGMRWLCHCDCGGSTQALTNNLNSGNTTSCGCKTAEARFTHGLSKHPVYRVWVAMRSRCNNPNDGAYRNYGGRGIKVCERWKDFDVFLSDMGMRPSGYDIDRIDNDGDYEPGNCHWITRKQNLNNRRNNQMLTWQGETLPVTTWAERLQTNPTTLFTRLHRGWSVEKVMTKPVKPRQRFERK